MDDELAEPLEVEGDVRDTLGPVAVEAEGVPADVPADVPAGELAADPGPDGAAVGRILLSVDG
ncbi:MAG TPA: hypothetical protein VI110_16450 [Lapillicoccus sp.]